MALRIRWRAWHARWVLGVLDFEVHHVPHDQAEGGMGARDKGSSSNGAESTREETQVTDYLDISLGLAGEYNRTEDFVSCYIMLVPFAVESRRCISCI